MSKEWVELGPTGLAIRIFRTKKAAAMCQTQPSHGLEQPIIAQMHRAIAVDHIRRQVYHNFGKQCAKCHTPLTLHTMELDEIQARGKCEQVSRFDYQSGEVSVANGQPLCRDCHTAGPEAKHNRAPSWSPLWRQIKG
jgi:hypothetical protein